MPPNSKEVPFQSSLGMKYPTYRDLRLKNTDIWLEGKRIDDGAEGLWRIHDSLYDLNDFIEKHPGGKFWLEMTKGTDITEAFEVHHISEFPEKLLPKFFVRKATTPRNSPFSFEENGFYRTLKKKVIPIMKDLPKRSSRKSDLYSDTLALSVFIFGVLATRFVNYYLAAICGLLMALVTIAGHNYLHRKDNWRMYYPDLSLMQSREWRMFHIFSHHLYTNTITDLEISLHEPILEFLPKNKTFIHKYFSFLYAPFYWLILNHIAFVKKIIIFVLLKRTSHLGFHDLVSFFPLIIMYIFGGQSFLTALKLWFFATLVASFWFNMIGFTAAHHHPRIFHDGDKSRVIPPNYIMEYRAQNFFQWTKCNFGYNLPGLLLKLLPSTLITRVIPPNYKRNYIFRPKIPFDWGFGQLDAVMDRFEIDGSHFLVLTNFGNHALHHFFPTLDHGQLEYLEPVFEETMKEFKIELRKTSLFDLILGKFQQIMGTKPNPNPPELFLKSQK